ncbi:MAG: MotA/TolQ/ExbB proton channel family protein [Marinilabiliaceae bacterium]|nr:MotA/TolQ/ExbB proton channel family protein [Marinilabiliaceae bacterium]
MTSLFYKFNDGGPFLTYPMLILLLVIIALFVKVLLNKTNNGKTIALITSLGWFTLAWGFLGRTFGLIAAFDAIQAVGELTPHHLAEGLKMALINPLFGITVFLIARLGIIILIWLKKDADFNADGSLK